MKINKNIIICEMYVKINKNIIICEMLREDK